MKQLTLGIILGALLIGCAGFGYKYYGLHLDDQTCYEKGLLLGKTLSDDKPFKTCAPDDQVKGKCVVMYSSDFFQLKAELERVKLQLIDCQKNCQL